jgi:GAF domain-containing protein
MVLTAPIDWALHMLDEAETGEAVQLILRQSVRSSVQATGSTTVLLENDLCYYADEDAMSPLWKGQRFPVSACISGWAMLNRQSVVIPDVTVDSRIPQEAYRPTFVRSLVIAPMRAHDPVGAIGAYWATNYRATESEVATLERIAEAAGAALARMPIGQGGTGA